MATDTPDFCAEPRTLTLESALERLVARIEPIAESETVALKPARGRILALAPASPLDLPPFANSAMDGYALRAEDSGPQATLAVIGTAWAGQPFTGAVGRGQCVRIFTGAVLPEGADAVVMQEQVGRTDDAIQLAATVQAGANIRPQGGELQAGQALLPQGKRLEAADLGLLAAAGLAEVPVLRRIKVAILSTGDELRPVGETLAPGQIHDSNRYLLDALLAELGAEILDFGTVADDPEALRRVLLAASVQADAIVSTGGASVGEADFVVEVLRDIGQFEFWKVAIKPGKPFAYGRIGAAHCFGLPGNPVAVAVTFRQLVRPALARLMGERPRPPLRLPARCETRLRKKPGRMEFQRGLYRRGPDGAFIVTADAGQGSDRLSSLSRANCYIVLPADNAGVEPGGGVEIEPFDAFL
ncbi:molybdopterin molybdotransferase MoeA [Methylomagnum ishizawai]|uniref:molybdopterin molybdotransferase MoeA n=1 Tax=Methylomagnum ishizawai TaxID=1760988 RepID=UPI001C33EB1A|nr:gephyrin-like molybdotransferase Glp [Methylomagnum ishizawai]BBL76348.1 molybdopterin molybdenumtransferase MoeA [Methylomagnum ishizawai]